jgi:hypothetical protein
MYLNQPAVPGGVGANGGGENGENKPPTIELVKLRRYRFIVQFAWKPTPPSEREQKKEQLRLERAQALQQSL